jgi:hypothetical protein
MREVEVVDKKNDAVGRREIDDEGVKVEQIEQSEVYKSSAINSLN